MNVDSLSYIMGGGDIEIEALAFKEKPSDYIKTLFNIDMA